MGNRVIFNCDKLGKSNIVRKKNGANEYWEGGEVSVVPDGPCGPPIFVLMEGWGTILKSEFPLDGGTSRSMTTPRTKYAPRGKCGPSRKKFPT
jgi:hypothetical protein